MSTFAVGDTVKLKSGSPVMTVAEVEGDDVVCIWFDKSQQNKQRFPAATLIKNKPRSGSSGIVPTRPPSKYSY